MKRKIFLIGILVVLLGITGLIFFFRYQNFQGVAPAIIPPQEDIVQQIETQTNNEGDQIPFPLKIPTGFKISIFAKGLTNARVLKFDPAGNLLVSQPSQGKITALIDSNKDGKSDDNKIVLAGLNRPHGLAFADKYLYVAETGKVSRYLYSNLTATTPEQLFTLPSGGNHFSRTIEFGKNGQLYTAIGSSCNVCEEKDEFRAKILVSDPDGKNLRVFAKGLRNTVFFELNPISGELWGADMGRDQLGDNLPPEEINIIRDGGDYGWPYCYGLQIHDNNFDPKGQNSCDKTTPPIFELQAHSAPLGLEFINNDRFPADWKGDLLVSYHGSWNRSTPTGYKVVRLHLQGNTITQGEDFISGWLSNNSASGRPVDLIFDKEGNLFISDDKAGVIYLVTYQR